MRGRPKGQPKKPKRLSSQQERFAQLVASGASQVAAYRAAYRNKTASNQRQAEMAHVIAHRPMVNNRIRELMAKSEAKTLLTLNERLGILATGARLPAMTASQLSAQARVIEVYSKISGDQAPERQEHTLRGDANAPLQVAHRPATKAEKVAALIAQRTTRTKTFPDGFPRETPAPPSPPTPAENKAG